MRRSGGGGGDEMGNPAGIPPRYVHIGTKFLVGMTMGLDLVYKINIPTLQKKSCRDNTCKSN